MSRIRFGRSLVALIVLLLSHFSEAGAAIEDCPSVLKQPQEMKKFGKQRVQAIRGWDKLITWTLSPKNKKYVLVAPVEERNYEVTEEDLLTFDANYGYFSIYHPIVGIVTKSERDIQATNCLVSSVDQEIKNVKQREFTEYEIFGKVTGYRPLQKGMTVIGPKGVEYIVDTVIDLWRGMPGFGLLPKSDEDAAPILLYRGTDLNLTSEKGWASVLSDLNTSGPGHDTFLRARDEIHEWLVKVKKSHRPASLVGFSLGGVFVYYTLIYESDQVNKTVPSVAFNPPGVSKELLAQWKEVKEKPPHISFVNEGDFVSQIGFLLDNVWVITLPKPLGVIAAHVTLISAQPKYTMQKVDVLKENQSRD